jgi:hypothetical protein
MRFWVLTALLLFALLGCNFRIDKTVALQSGAGQLGFAFIQQSVLGPRCLSCHAGPASPRGVDLSTYSTVMAGQLVVPNQPNQSPLYDSMATGRMPKGLGRLPEGELNLVRDWIAAGAPEIAANPIEPVVPEPVAPEPTWAWLSNEILQKRCTGCHNGAHPKTELDLRSYETLMDFMNLGMPAVEPGDPSSSTLYLNLKEALMPPNGPATSKAELEAIKEWINQGALKETT